MTIALYIFAYYVSVLVVYAALSRFRDGYCYDNFDRAMLAFAWPLALTAIVFIAPFVLIDKLRLPRRGDK
jgi:hypothetical protein